MPSEQSHIEAHLNDFYCCIGKVDIENLRQGYPNLQVFCEEKMDEDKDGVSQDTDDGQIFLPMETQLLIGKLLLTPPYPNKTKQNLCFLYHIMVLLLPHLQRGHLWLI